MHAIHATQSEGRKVVYLDFQLIDEANQTDLAGFLRVLSEAIAEQLDLDWI